MAKYTYYVIRCFNKSLDSFISVTNGEVCEGSFHRATFFSSLDRAQIYLDICKKNERLTDETLGICAIDINKLHILSETLRVV